MVRRRFAARPLRSLALGLVLVAPLLAPAIAGADGSTACAAGRAHVALVVDTGARTTTYCVVLTSTTATGLQVIQLAAAQYGMDYRLGFGGAAVCRIDHVGTDGGDCFGDYPDFWGYWHGTVSGGWTWAGSGAGSSTVGDGAVEGWSWGSGNSGTSHPPPPRVRLSDVCTTSSPTPTSTPSTRPSPTPHGSVRPSPSPRAPASSVTPSAPVSAAPSHHASPKASSTPAPSPTPAGAPPSPVIVRAVATSGTTPSNGPPTGAILAAVAVLVLVVAGWFTTRRRGSRGGTS